MTAAPELGRIEKIDLREVWRNEAADFTPWLADDVSKLGEAFGAGTRTPSAGSPGRALFSGLAGPETGRNRAVIIENQLEPPDHDHPGKLLTYAGGQEADVVVWIAREFRFQARIRPDTG